MNQDDRVIGELSESGQAQVNDFSSDGVATSGGIASCVLLAGDQLFRVQQLSVKTGSDSVNDGWLKIQEHTSGDVLAGASLEEKVSKASSPVVLSDRICPSG